MPASSRSHRPAGALGRRVALWLGLTALLAGCAAHQSADGGQSPDWGPRPGPIVTDPPGALDDLGWIPHKLLVFNDLDHDGVLNAAEQRRVRRAVIAREACDDGLFCF